MAFNYILILLVVVCLFSSHVEIRWSRRHHGEQEHLADVAWRIAGHILLGLHRCGQHRAGRCHSAADSVHLWPDSGHTGAGECADTL